MGDDYPDVSKFCLECNGLGWIRCECGGDICVCVEYGSMGGEMPCPSCYPGHYSQDDEDESVELAELSRKEGK